MSSPRTPRPVGAEPGTPGRWRGVRRVALLGAVAILCLVGLLASATLQVSEQLAGRVHRHADVFTGLDPDARPPPTRAMTFLFVGTDSASGAPVSTPSTRGADGPSTGTDAAGSAARPGSRRSDVIMLVQLSADRSAAGVVSVPRDSWVQVPGLGPNKINAAYAAGGPSLLVHTVESLTHVRIDHFGVIDFAGFRAMTDALGGIDVQVARTTTFGPITFRAGPNHLDGRRALAYVRQRKGLPRDDLDRVRRQQNALRALLDKARSQNMLTNPSRMYGLLDAVTRSVSMDDTLTNSRLRSLAVQLRGVRDVAFLTAPVAGVGHEGLQAVVHLDPVGCAELWRALSDGDLGAYLREHPDDLLPAVPA